jgi:hypothetical protein
LKGKNTIKITMETKVGILIKDYIWFVSYMYWFIKYWNYILNIISGVETKHDSYYNKNYIFLHEDLDYSQKYNFVFNHDDKFWTFLTINAIQNQNRQHSLKWFNICAFKDINTRGIFYEVDE